MNIYQTEELNRFLEEVDVHLAEFTPLLIIGGAAVALGYGIDRATRDIDTWEELPDELAEAVIKARETTKLEIPLHHAAVADAPYEFESRLQQIALQGLKRLVIFVPEKHDLVLMKIIRCYEHDLEAAEAIHSRWTLDFYLLVERYLEEMGHVIGDRKMLDLKMLATVERVFDESKLRTLEVKLKSRK